VLPPAAAPGSRADTLGELRAVIHRIESRLRAAPPPRRPASLEEAVGGALEPTAAGPVLVVRRRLPLAAGSPGALQATARLDGTPLALLARTPPPAAPRLLYLDTETTGLAGGTGTYVFLVGAGFVDGAEFEVRQYFLRDLDEEPALLAALAALLRDFDGLVTYNGTGFDLPLLETRFVLGRQPGWPAEPFHLDLLPPARRLWGARLEDCRLATVERHVLGVVRQDDIPGALIPSVYFEYLRRRALGALPRVFEHNRQDIVSLAALTGRAATLLARAPCPELEPVELAGLGRLWEATDPERAAACYRLALELGLPSPLREQVLRRLAREEKRRARWDEARRLWEAVARGPGAFDPRPWEEVAKIDEHRRRDLAAARAVVEEALGLARRARAPERALAALGHRLERLRRRGGIDAP
jgi:hypothetical protein